VNIHCGAITVAAVETGAVEAAVTTDVEFNHHETLTTDVRQRRRRLRWSLAST
jgi:hypothetical protein